MSEEKLPTIEEVIDEFSHLDYIKDFALFSVISYRVLDVKNGANAVIALLHSYRLEKKEGHITVSVSLIKRVDL